MIPAFAAESADPAPWIARIQKNREDALAWFNLGVTYQNQKDAAKALRAYAKVVELKSSLAPVARYYQALLYQANRDIEKAKAALEPIDVSKVPANLRERVLKLKNQLFLGDFASSDEGSESLDGLQAKTTETKKEAAFSGSLDLNYGSNSNPQTLADLTTNAISSDKQTQAKLFFDYLAVGTSAFELRANYTGAGTFFDQNGSMNYTYHDVMIPAAVFFSIFRVRLTPEFYSDTYDNRGFSSTQGATLDATARIGDTYYGLSYLGQTIKNSTSTYSYLSGSQSKIALTAQSSWSVHRLSFGVTVSNYKYEDTATLSSSYKSTTVSAGYTQLILPWIVGGTIAYEQRAYPKAASDTTARQDRKSYLQAQVGYLISPNFKWTVDASQTNNGSNFNTTTDDRTYKQTTLTTGFSLTF